ncbi:MAG: hypothetical protein JST92_25620 [Deltaproteobacteria bacterium]|nr:hypothetical protein [Deltaproteobacteria bacterium]
MRCWAVVLVTGAFALAACGSNSPVPCSPGACATVAGDYTQSMIANHKDCGGGHSLDVSAETFHSHLVQTDAQLQLQTSSFVGNMNGTLHADGSAEFGPAPAVAVDESGGGGDEPGKLYLSGWFASDNLNLAPFEGTYVFIADDTGCEIDSRVTWR